LTYPSSDIREYFFEVKGLSLNLTTLNIVNFDSMKILIEDDNEYQNQIRERGGNPNEQKVFSVPQKTMTVKSYLDLVTKEIAKKYRFAYYKRRIITDLTTVPFGYLRIQSP
jgi:hypothetical protein